MQLPHLTKHAASSSQLTDQAIQLEHYMGPYKVNPPELLSKNMPANELQLQLAAVTFSQQQDAAWLLQIHVSNMPIE